MALHLLLFLLAPPISAALLPHYTNHTVGGAAGWLFDPRRNAAAADYTAWASSRTFFLGDFLVFNTDGRSTVILTFNATTYALCDQRKDFGNLTSQFVSEEGEAGGIAVELTVEGANYFFSDAQEGLQCRKGMRFRIDVGHGRGLPSPPPPPQPKSTVLQSPQKSAGRRRRVESVAMVVAVLPLACCGFPPF